ncbi:MAG: efflux RND transporter permease subunit [Candidatus Hydrogenedentota bacterium]
MKRFISTMIRNQVMINLIMVVIILFGAVSSSMMVKEFFPEISVDMIQIGVPFPGADPAEVEEGISLKIEEAIDGMEGIKQYRTISSESFSTAVIEVKEGYDADVLYRDVRNRIDTISTFPVNAEKPSISKPTIFTEVILLAISGDFDERTIKEFSEEVKDEIQALPSVSQVAISGAREYEIAIEISEEQLREYGLSFQEVSQAVRRGSVNLSGGTMRTKGEEIRLRTVGRNYSGEDFADIVVVARPNGDVIKLGQLATINDGFSEDRFISRFNGEPCIMVSISKTPSEDTIQIVKEVRAYVEKKQQQLPEGINLTLWSDFSIMISDQIALLVKNGLLGLAIVFFSLWFFLDLRLSFWVTMGIPISLSGGLLLMWLLGESLNTFSILALIMVLGIVVDDAIIVGEAIYVHRRRGDGPAHAAVNGVMEVGMPVLAAVTTSIIAFLPLGVINGVLGSFVRIIPVAVVASLLVSILECLFILPGHLNHLPEFPAADATPKNVLQRNRKRVNGLIDFVIFKLYKPTITQALHFRYITLSLAIGFFFITIAFVGAGYVKFVIFSEGGSNEMTASVEFPNGTPMDTTHEAIMHTSESLQRVIGRYEAEEGNPILINDYSVTGVTGDSFFDRTPGNNLGMIRVELVDATKRTVQAKELAVAWEKETGKIPGTIAQTFQERQMGPPGTPIMISLRGRDRAELMAVSAELQTLLRGYDGVYQIQDTFRPGKNEMRLDIKPEARNLGLTLEDLARQVHAGYYGDEALRIQRGRDDVRVKVRYTEDERSTLAQLEQVRIRTPQGYEVPFFSVADVEFEAGNSNIIRVDGQKDITVTAQVVEIVANPTEILREFSSIHLPELKERYTGFEYTFDGPQNNARDAFLGLQVTLPIALFFIFLVIASIFRSYVQPLVIMFTIPFGIVGAIYGHMFMGIPIAMFSIFGMVALTGVVVNDAIVLIEAINGFMATGMKAFDSIIMGGVRRFRAIMLTSISTVGGLLPLILEKDAQAQMVIPMALSIASGVLFATFLTLFFIPCLMGVLNDLRRVTYMLLHGTWPTRELVEPARTRNVDPLAEEAAGDVVMAK